jgi:phage replication-related protein YjqB (UPF0714/DUF867 family)
MGFEGDDFLNAQFDDFKPNGYNSYAAPPPPGAKAEVNVEEALNDQDFDDDKYACSVPKSLVGIAVGDQIRITRNADERAVYTVAEKRDDEDPNIVRMGTDARERLGTSNTFAADLISPVCAVGLTDEEAEEAGEFVERLVDDGSYTAMVVMAPHGGGIEDGSDFQAEAVAEALGCSSWICKGYAKDGGGYSRWHVTTTKVSPRSFPGLKVIANRGFTYAVAFHGMAADGILVGGGASMEFKELVRDAILDALSDPDIEVTAVDGGPNSGTSSKNVVNWITVDGEGGIQLEQSSKVRDDHWQEVADAVISVYSQLI